MTIQSLIELASARGGLGTDDVLASLLPLFRQVAASHEAGLVAPLRGLDALAVDEQLRVTFDPALASEAARAESALAAIERRSPSAVEITAHSEAVDDVAGGTTAERSLDVAYAGEEITRPVLVPAWEVWEHRIGHHDELTDVASLGQLLAALAAGLDLGLREDIDRLARHRTNLFVLAPELHPVVVQVASRMLEPERHARAQDLRSIIERLETYRDQPLDFDLERVAGGQSADERRGSILAVLRDRLFDLSRRNRLIWFRPTQQSLNLTEASVPLVLDARNIRPDQLFTWSPAVAERVLSRRDISLGSVVRWEDAPYAAGVLDTVISQARRDRSEYGQAQLRLVVAFLRWNDLKGDRDERISSPLLLLPVGLTKKRGVRDSYVLTAESTEAEVNPALRQFLRQLYGLELPAVVDLATESVAELHARLAADIRRTEPAVELRLRDRPRIELVHRRALVRLEAFQRRAGRGAVTLGRRAYAYSYRRRDYRPLGLQLFHDHVVHRPAPMAVTFGAAPAPRSPGFTSPAPAPPPAPGEATREQETYVLDDGATGNPYAWDLDLCAVTLANFNYRTMSLVRDYRELLESSETSQSFDRIFALEPRPLDDPERPELPLHDRFLVVPADGSQVAALAHARRGGSLVIQGPPGTGKSQTITNLVADYVARGKRVLFVCQKRAAIDVVHARLRQRGLDELAALIHDSQADKKAFVHGLRATYDAWLADLEPPDAAEAERAGLLAEIEASIAQVAAYEEALAEPGAGGGPTLRALIERLVDLRDQRWGDDLLPAERRLLPDAAAWWAARPTIDRIAAVLVAAGEPPVLSLSPLARLADEVLAAPRPDAEVAHRAGVALVAVRVVAAAIASAERTSAVRAEPSELTLGDAAALGDLGARALPLAERGQGSVFSRSSVAAASLRSHVTAWHARQAALARAAEAAAGWHAPLRRDEAPAALEVAREKEHAFLRFLDGRWRRVQGAVKRGFTGQSRAVPTSVTEALALLVAWQAAEVAMEDAAGAADAIWGARDPAALAERIEAVRQSTLPAVAEWREHLAADTGTAVAEALLRVGNAVVEARPALAAILTDVERTSLANLAAQLEVLESPRAAALVRASAPPVRELAAHPAVATAVRSLVATPDEIEFAVAATALEEAVAPRPELARFDGQRLTDTVARIQELLPRLYAADAAVIIGRVRGRFLDAVALAARSATGMTAAERDRKKAWTAGRRELENEFRKVMRYRSIRDLSSGDPGEVVAALRPIWLMSPTSVSDTLPLDPSAFDLVVYDEASQIPVEEAVPAMHRAHQVIVVGDRMQLPPSQFFAVRSELADDPEDEFEVGVVLDGDSFLAQCAGRLPSTMLTWHYRSRSEALIAFSNAAFYNGRLATIPDRRPLLPALPEITVPAGADAAAYGDRILAGVDALLERPISFHRIERSPYVRRTNPGEAAYIAGLVAELLRRDTGLTIGIVAFSEAQQSEIEAALEVLAHQDPDFAARFEAELVREDDDQGVGLFVKNLENVQGDERDVILMSVCYGPDPDGRMIMNFGPINQDGGEKRLNVIFSRARRHMAIVSSIGPEAITNTYNDGASTLRAFLEYAAASSRGDSLRAASVLGGFGDRRRRRTDGDGAGESAAAAQIAAALRERGIEATERVGQSSFRADLALRRPGDDSYRVAVMVDHPERLAAQPVAERLLSHPGVLQAAGWHVAHVLTGDWHEQPEAVLESLERALAAAEIAAGAR